MLAVHRRKDVDESQRTQRLHGICSSQILDDRLGDYAARDSESAMTKCRSVPRSLQVNMPSDSQILSSNSWRSTDAERSSEQLRGGRLEDNPRIVHRKSASIPSLLEATADEWMDMRSRESSAQHFPVGLQNLGNTCYQNAVLQALFFTEELRRYFIGGKYELDFPTEKQGQSNNKEPLAESLSVLMTTMSKGKFTLQRLHHFKYLINSKLPQFNGVGQHDAQEFLFSLLDLINSELDPQSDGASRSPCDQEPGFQGQPRPLVQLFQGQFSSRLLCNSCSYHSTTFEPFNCLSLPIPNKKLFEVPISLVYRKATSSRGPQSKINCVEPFYVSPKLTIRGLRCAIAKEKGMTKESIVLVEMKKDGFGTLFRDDMPSMKLLVHQNIHAFEAPPYIPSINKSEKDREPILILLTNKIVKGKGPKRFGYPTVLRVWKDLTQDKFQSVVLNAMKDFLKPGIDIIETSSKATLFSCKVVDHHGNILGELTKENETGLFHQGLVDSGVLEAVSFGLTPHVRVVAEWTNSVRDRTVKYTIPTDFLTRNISCYTRCKREKYANLTSLHECISQYIQEEHIAGVNWKCPLCGHKHTEIVKKMDFHNLPKVLVVSIKRFNQVYDQSDGRPSRSKLETKVDFPIKDLNMTPHMAEERQTLSPVAMKTEKKKGKDQRRVPRPLKGQTEVVDEKTKFSYSKKMWSKLKTGKVKQEESAADQLSKYDSPLKEHLYDLYAVINHKGSLESGHYTAVCKGPQEGKWYLLDDSKVHEVAEKSIVTENAYLLFYARKDVADEDIKYESMLQSHHSSLTSMTDIENTKHFTLNALSPSDGDSRYSLSSVSRSKPDSGYQSVASTRSLPRESPLIAINQPDSADIDHSWASQDQWMPFQHASDHTLQSPKDFATPRNYWSTECASQGCGYWKDHQLTTQWRRIHSNETLLDTGDHMAMAPNLSSLPRETLVQSNNLSHPSRLNSLV